MKIADLELHAVEIPHRDGREPIRSLLIVLMDDRGRQGYGEAPLRWRPDELPQRRKRLLGGLAGRSLFEIEEMLRLPIVSSPALASLLEMASWDIIGRSLGQPLCHLWGGAYRVRTPLTVRLPARSPEEIARLSDELAEQGYRDLLYAATGDVRSDFAALIESGPLVADRARLQVDGGGRFSVDSAAELCAESPDHSVTVLLDPLPRTDIDGLTQLARRTSSMLGIAAGISSPADVLSLARRGAVSHVSIDLNRVGGILAARRCMAVAEAAGMSVSLRADASVGIALAAALQTAASTPVCEGVHIGDDYRVRDDVCRESIRIADGFAATPDGSGLGVSIDAARLEAYAAN